MATTENRDYAAENPILNRLKGKRTAENNVEKTNRKTLQTLQYSSKGDNLLIGHNNENKLNGGKTSIKHTSKPIKIFADIKPLSPATLKKSCDHNATQTDESLLEDLIEAKIQKTDLEKLGRSREANLTSSLKLRNVDVSEQSVLEDDLLGGEPSEHYWRELAERRRQALNDTLEENESLHNQNISLREENEKLTEVASQAENMVSFLQSVVGDDGEEEISSDGGDVISSERENENSSDGDNEYSSDNKKNPDVKTSSDNGDDDWLNIELEGETVKSTEITTSTPEAVDPRSCKKCFIT
ncbi:hypothetical protein SNE40_004663 [Patella caerulea]|uniref:Geminin n=1 Tax=Patella caerulea TaxID=87958 RepID=A0AAN8PYD6_PATCE